MPEQPVQRHDFGPLPRTVEFLEPDSQPTNLLAEYHQHLGLFRVQLEFHDAHVGALAEAAGAVTDPQERGRADNATLLADNSRRKVYSEALYFQGTHDKVTGALNRTGLDDYLIVVASEIVTMPPQQSENLEVGILFVDADRFKQLNDTHGHRTGDMGLAELTDRLDAGIVRGQPRQPGVSKDAIARYGGDEIVLVIHGLNHEDIAEIAAKLQQDVQSIVFEGEHGPAEFGASIGLLHKPLGEIRSADDLFELVSLADKQMYEAKLVRKAQEKTKRMQDMIDRQDDPGASFS